MEEEKVLNQTLEQLEKNGAEAAYLYLLEKRNQIIHPTGQVYNYLYCLAAVSGKKEEALHFVEEAILEKGLWYRPEVLEDEDLSSIAEDERFLRCKEISEKRYQEECKNVRTCFSWQEKKKAKLAIALHGNQQNMRICHENWSFLEKQNYQLECVQSANIDSIHLYRWEDEQEAQLPSMMKRIEKQGYEEILLCGFSSGCNEILKSIPEKTEEKIKLVLVSPWIPILSKEGKNIVEKIVRNKIPVYLYCGEEDEDCYSLTVEFEHLLKEAGGKVESIYEAGIGHVFPEKPMFVRS